MNLAPVVLFVYNRPWHTEEVLKSLEKNSLSKDSKVFIFSDGPRSTASLSEIENIKSVRDIVYSKNWNMDITVYESNVNRGLSDSIISGVNIILSQYEKAIFLEDDILPERGFLNYMNEALEMYEYDNNVGCIHAWNYNIDTVGIKDTSFFLKGADCWGWATWKRAWSFFEDDGKYLLDQIVTNNLNYSFNRNGTHNFIKILQDQINGENDSWAIRWHASLFLKGLYCLHPVKSIVRNIGLDGSGTHCGAQDFIQTTVDNIILNKIEIKESDWFFVNYKKAIIINSKKSSDV